MYRLKGLCVCAALMPGLAVIGLCVLVVVGVFRQALKSAVNLDPIGEGGVSLVRKNIPVVNDAVNENQFPGIPCLLAYQANVFGLGFVPNGEGFRLDLDKRGILKVGNFWK